jgi:ribonuclease HI
MMEIYIDGGCKGNPGRGKAVVVVQPLLNPISGKKRNGQIIVKDLPGTVTNNAAEYESLLAALDYIKEHEYQWHGKKKQITIYTDSQLIAGHINKGWKVNKNTVLVTKAKEKILELDKVNIIINIKWIRRELNLAGQKIENGEV